MENKVDLRVSESKVMGQPFLLNEQILRVGSYLLSRRSREVEQFEEFSVTVQMGEGEVVDGVREHEVFIRYQFSKKFELMSDN